MKKTSRRAAFLTVLLVAVMLISVAGLASCSDKTPEKYLVSYKTSDSYSDFETEFFYTALPGGEYVIASSRTFSDGVLVSKSEMNYDAQGRRISELVTMLSVKGSRDISYEYDTAGRISIQTMVVTDADGGKTTQTVTYEYTDGNGSYIKKTSLGGGDEATEVYTYDERGGLISYTDSAGVVTERENRYNIYGTIDASELTTGDTTTKITYSYDAEYKNLIGETLWSESGMQVSTTVYEYSENPPMA